jgi:hypothetical protein
MERKAPMPIEGRLNAGEMADLRKRFPIGLRVVVDGGRVGAVVGHSRGWPMGVRVRVDGWSKQTDEKFAVDLVRRATAEDVVYGSAKEEF